MTGWKSVCKWIGSVSVMGDSHRNKESNWRGDEQAAQSFFPLATLATWLAVVFGEILVLHLSRLLLVLLLQVSEADRASWNVSHAAAVSG